MRHCWCADSDTKRAIGCKNLTAASWVQLLTVEGGRKGGDAFMTDRPLWSV